MEPMLMRMPDTYEVPEDWRFSVPKIMEVSRYLYSLHGTMPSRELELFLRGKMKMDVSSCHKIMKLSQHKIISDPCYAGILPPEWGKLYELSFLPEEILLEKIKDGSVLKLTKYQIWQLRGGKPVKSKKNPQKTVARLKMPPSMTHPRILIPPSVSLIGLVRKGMDLEKNKQFNPPMAAKEIGLGEITYRRLKTVVMLADSKNLLSEKDSSLVIEVLNAIEKTRKVKLHYPRIAHLKKRIWGEARGVGVTKKGEIKRREEFINRVTALSAACERGAEIEIPYLPSKDMKESIDSITGAVSSLMKLRKRIMETIS